MEPTGQHTIGDDFEPLSQDAEGPLSLGPEWSSVYEDGAGSTRWHGSPQAAEWVDSFTAEELLAESGIEPVVSTAEAAEYFGRTTQWIYWGLKPDSLTGEIRFVWPDGTPIEPERAGDPQRGRRRFTTSILRAILECCYRRGNIDPEELKTILRRIRYTEVGIEWREREGWKYVDLGRNRHRWVRPEDAVYDQDTKSWKLAEGVK